MTDILQILQAALLILKYSYYYDIQCRCGNIVTPKTLGFLSVNDEAHSHEDMKGKVMDEVKRIFKPEFINRIDEIIVFHTLGKEQIGQIVDIMMQTVNKRTLEQMKLSIELDEQAKNYLVEKDMTPSTGQDRCAGLSRMRLKTRSQNRFYREKQDRAAV